MIMVRGKEEDFGAMDQQRYDEMLSGLELAKIECVCSSRGMKVHGYYERSIHSSEGKTKLRVMRLKCPCCGRTHAVLPSVLVPYQQLCVRDQHQMVIAYEKGESPENVCTPEAAFDENNVRSVIRRYKKFWRAKIRQLGEDFHTDLCGLLDLCRMMFSAQFMQIRDAGCVIFT